jgi:hypothetical protein
MNFLQRLWTTPAKVQNPDHSWYTRPQKTRLCNPSRSFLDTRENWWVFDWQAQVPLAVPGSRGMQEDVFTDRKFVMYKDTIDGDSLAFSQQMFPLKPMAPAKIKGRVHLLTPDQIKELDETMLHGVQSIRSRVRLVFPNFIKEFPKKKYEPVEHTTMYAWMYFDRAQPWHKRFEDDFALFRGREKATLKPVPINRHHREHIRNYFNIGHLPKREGYTKVNEIHTITPTMSQVS